MHETAIEQRFRWVIKMLPPEALINVVENYANIGPIRDMLINCLNQADKKAVIANYNGPEIYRSQIISLNNLMAEIDRQIPYAGDEIQKNNLLERKAKYKWMADDTQKHLDLLLKEGFGSEI